MSTLHAVITAPGGWIIPVTLAWLMCLAWFWVCTKIVIHQRTASPFARTPTGNPARENPSVPNGGDDSGARSEQRRRLEAASREWWGR